MSSHAALLMARSREMRLPPRLKLSLSITSALGALLVAGGAHGQQWTGAASSDVTNSNNWNPAPTDSFGDVVINGGTHAAVWTASGPLALPTVWGDSRYWNVNSLSVGSGGTGQFTFNVASGNTEERAYLYAANGTALAVGTAGSGFLTGYLNPRLGRRNVLRLGAWELLFAEDVPEHVALSEAVELVRELSTDESPAYVNGVLGSIQRAKADLV